MTGIFKDKAGLFILGLVLLVMACIYSGCIDTEILGFTRDDGIYTLTAKALAQGQGFVLPHLPGHPAQIRYPIIYPLILALGWFLQPQFPQNMALLTWLTMGFTLAGLAAVYATIRWLKQGPIWLATLITVLVGVNFYFVFAATSLMSEGPYLCFSVFTLFLAERLWGKKKVGDTPPTAVELGWVCALSVLTFHTRVMGLLIMGAIGIWLLTRRFWKAAMIYGLASLLLGAVPWFVWVNTHRPPDELSVNTFVWLNAYTDYHSAFDFLFKTGTYWVQLVGTTGMFFFNFLETIFPAITIFLQVNAEPLHLLKIPYAVKAYVVFQTLMSFWVPGWFLLKGISILRTAVSKKSWQGFSMSGLYVSVYLLVTLAWNFESQMSRFLAMVTPWLWWWLLGPIALWGQQRAINAFPNAMRKVVPIGVAAGVCLAMLGLNISPSWVSLRFLAKARQNHWVDGGEFPDLWENYRAAYAYIKTRTPVDALVATAYEMPLALYSGHPVLNLFLTNLPALQTHNNIKQSIVVLMGALDHFGVRYLLMDPQQLDHKVQETDNSVMKDLIARYPERFRLVYLSPNSFVSVYEVLPRLSVSFPLSRE